VRAAWASAGVVAEVRSWTFSLTVRDRSPSDYVILVVVDKFPKIVVLTSLIFAG